MSAKLTGAVWELDLPRPEKYVLLALADHAKEDGSDVYPSLARVEWKTGYSETQVRQIMRALVQKRILVLVRKGGKGPGSTDCYRIDLNAAKELTDFRTWVQQTKGTKTEPLTGIHKGTETEPIKGAVSEAKGAVSEEERVRKPNPNQKPEPSSRTKPSASDDADPRHHPIRDGIRQLHASYNGMPVESVPWDGGEGAALAKLLVAQPRLSVEDALVCAANRYESVVNRAERIRRWLPRLIEYWSGPVDEFNKPLFETGRERRSQREAAVGARRL